VSFPYFDSALKNDLFSNIPDNFAKARVYPLSCQSFEKKKTPQNSLQICKNGFHSFLNLFGSSTLNTHCDPSIRKRDMIWGPEMTWPGSSEFSIKYWISPAPPLSDPHIRYKPVNKLSAWLHSGILLLLVIRNKTLPNQQILQHWVRFCKIFDSFSDEAALTSVGVLPHL